MGRLAEERGVVYRAQVDKQLGAPAGGIDPQDVLVKLRETGKALDLHPRAQPRLQQAHAMRLQGDADLMPQERHDGGEVFLRPGLGLRRRGWQHAR